VQADHPDLVGQVVAGKDFVTPGVTDGMSDFYGHGTHVAGIAAAEINGVGGVGGAPNAEIVSARVLNCSGSGSLSNVAQGVVWASTPVSQGGGGAQVINLSLGAFGPDGPGTALASLDQVIADAESRGVVVTAAAGNCGLGGQDCLGVVNEPLYPAANGSVIAVASIDQTSTSSDFSNSGSYVSIAAPGSGILSACPSSLPASKCAPSAFPGYSFKDGTSMATPFVSAAAALLSAACPSSPRNQAWVNFVKKQLQATVEQFPGGTPQGDVAGTGILDAGKALTTLTTPDVSAPNAGPCPT
jgi:thermitase